MSVLVEMDKEDFVEHMKWPRTDKPEPVLEALYDYYSEREGRSITPDEIMGYWDVYSADWAGLEVNERDGKKYPTLEKYTDEIRRRTTVLDVKYRTDRMYHVVKRIHRRGYGHAF